MEQAHRDGNVRLDKPHDDDDSKFALRPDHVPKYGRHPICERKKKKQDKNIMSSSAMQGSHNKIDTTEFAR